MITLIGINGYIGSGKDTVGGIIQELVSYPEPHKQYSGKSWEIRKFAGKLKQIASLLTGIPVEKFEDQEFKKSFLPSEWSWYMPNLGSPGPEKNGTYAEQKMTVREFLQKLGTDAIRYGLHENAWVNATFADYKSSHYLIGEFDTDLSQGTPVGLPKWILTDCRFPNEAQAIKDRGGIVIRVNRNVEPGIQILEDNSRKYTELHPSETSLDNWSFDYVINNDGSIEDLITKVKEMLLHFGILTPEVENN